MAKKAMLAGLDMAEHVIAHDELSSTISETILEAWTLEIEAWEQDPTQPNPFEEKIEGIVTWSLIITHHLRSPCRAFAGGHSSRTCRGRGS